MYGRTEHRYYLRRLGDVNRELDCQREIVATLYHEVRNDLDSSIAYDALSQFGAARRAIAAAMQAVDKAVALLPAPVA